VISIALAHIHVDGNSFAEVKTALKSPEALPSHWQAL